MRQLSLLLLAACCVVACEGPIGPPGRTGRAGEPAPTGHDAGIDAGIPARDAGSNDAGMIAIDAGEPELDGLFGKVRDRSDRPLVSGRVFLVSAARVAALAKGEIDLALSPTEAAAATNDEPLEDVIDRYGESLPSAPIDAEGNYRFSSIPDGSFFVVYQPAKEDDAHLPGGDAGRTPRSAESLRGARLDLNVSSTPSAAARYVGSTPCVTCHARHTSFESAHALTLRVPGQSSPMQDASSVPRIDEGLSFFQNTTLYFYDCAAGREPLPACRVSSTVPADLGSIRMRVRLRRDASVAIAEPGAFYVELESQDGSDVQRYPVVLTIGGSLSYQQYVTRVPLPNGAFTHLTLPFSYQLAGSDQRVSYRDFKWVAYRAEDWVSLTDGTLSRPSYPQAFERQCAGCHVTGLSVTGDETNGFRGAAAAERDGVYDLDGDGRKELLAVGCESCHGPGSEHVETSPRGQRIVSPQLLTPERQTMLCGNCHGRHRGEGGMLAPLDASQHMPRPGVRRSEFLSHVSAIEHGDDVFFTSGDSSVGRQQYTDFLRSPKYRSAKLLATCSDCHAPHREAELPSDLRYAADDSAGCAGCHAKPSKDVNAHALKEVRYDHVSGVDASELTCIGCHMVKTGTAGAHTAGFADNSAPGQPKTYLMGDRTSHRFAYVDRSQMAEQPTAASSNCAYCHADIWTNP